MSSAAGSNTALGTGETALVHDYLLVMRGAERAFATIASIWPDAPISTLLYDERGTEGSFAARRVRTSYLQRLGVRQGGFRRLLPLYPRAAERLPVSGHRLVISSSTAFAHGVRPDSGAFHACYCATPFRYAWHERERALAEAPPALRPLLSRRLSRIRRWDLEASRRVDRYIAVSELSRERIRSTYGRDAVVVHPPVEVDRFAPAEAGDELLFVGEVVAHKRVEVALEAAAAAGRRIKVVGTGPELPRLRERYRGAEFLGRVGDAELARLMARSLALVVPNVEEFGIAAVEAQAAGRPVLAADAGGARETIRDGETGVLLPEGDVVAFADCMRSTDFSRFSPDLIRTHALGFAPDRFKRRFLAAVEEAPTEARAPQ